MIAVASAPHPMDAEDRWRSDVGAVTTLRRPRRRTELRRACRRSVCEVLAGFNRLTSRLSPDLTQISVQTTPATFLNWSIIMICSYRGRRCCPYLTPNVLS